MSYFSKILTIFLLFTSGLQALPDVQVTPAEFKAYQKAAELGNADAQYNLADSYEFGFGTPIDLEKAFYWYTQAAKQGHPEAEWSLGLCYQDGTGTQKDPKLAFEWFTKAAAHGDADAQYNCGRCYELGLGTDVNLQEALAWYTKASAQGHAQALEKLKNNANLAPKITKEKPKTKNNAKKESIV